ncbi:flavodoxin [Ructibacterium gallinarum]|uniref:SUMF1/EgtB/PvdO family nonheme iron enzyme n=1 Tax=Ructibacterium gallinarum TaxID=2779355 RepID=A0A9D5R7Q2_9FIRM|nr:flavodoxin [Ructibacterium gallinarum]MBE5039055.1 SUMF1/EgtB/PvdO family nonheme iron enzyme [Ructibacterium gallinarum]
MKKTISLFLTVCMVLLAQLTPGYAADTEEIILQINNPMMIANGTEKEIDPGRGTVPIITDDRTLVPVRAIVEEIGGTVAWDEATQTATLTYGDDEIRLTLNSSTAYLNDEAQTLDVVPVSINDRTMLPIRFIAEGFHFDVEWAGETQTITIIKEDNTKPEQIEDDNMLLISGGTFNMGSDPSEAERVSDEKEHTVSVDSFYLAKTELTQKEYQEIMGSNPSENVGENLPVENITWYDAICFCNALSEKYGLDPVYTIDGQTVSWDKSANGYRLPTEAEWEYACRANTQTPFSFGDYVYDEDANCYNAYGYNNDASGSWVNGYLGKTVDVDSYNANHFGLYNMHGNVAEWVWDWYGEYDTNAAENPTGPESGSYKVARGGGWNDFPKHIRSAYRSAYPADVPLYSIGMRVARNADGSTGEVKSVYGVSAEQSTGKTLIAYFSQTGNTDGLAKIIADISGADIFRIERETPYSSSHNGTALYGEALDELRSGELPNLKTYLEDAGLDINQYDTILLGYCNWWASIPAPVSSFLDHYDLSGKTIIPFCSMGGGRFGQGISMIAKLEPDSVIKEGLAVTYSSYDREEIEDWLRANEVIE